jgi:hypothetical protein
MPNHSQFFEKIKIKEPINIAGNSAKNLQELLDEVKNTNLLAQELHNLEREIEQSLKEEFEKRFGELLQNLVNGKIKNLEGLLKELAKETKEKLLTREITRNFIQKNSNYILDVDSEVDKLAYPPIEKNSKEICLIQLDTLKMQTKLEFSLNLEESIKNFLENNSSIKKEAMENFFDKDPKTKIDLAGIDLKKFAEDARKNYLEKIAKKTGADNFIQRGDLESDLSQEQKKSMEDLIVDSKFKGYLLAAKIDLDNIDKNLQIEEKQKVIKKYLLDETKKFDNPTIEKKDSDYFNKVIKSICISMVGKELLSYDDFKIAFEEAKKESGIPKLFEQTENDEEFSEIYNADSPEKKAIELFEQQQKEIAQADANFDKNKIGYGLRKYGDLFSSSLYILGEKIFYTAIGLGIVLSGFNPLKMFNPVMIAAAAGIFGAVKYYKPDLFTNDPIQEMAKINLKNNLEQEQKINPTVLNWFNKISLVDIKEDGSLYNLIDEDNRESFSSEKIKNSLQQKTDITFPTEKIEKGSPEAYKLFSLLNFCKVHEIDPKSYLN